LLEQTRRETDQGDAEGAKRIAAANGGFRSDRELQLGNVRLQAGAK